MKRNYEFKTMAELENANTRKEMEFTIAQLKLAIYSAEEIGSRRLEKIIVSVDDDAIFTYDILFTGGITFTYCEGEYKWSD